MTRRYLLTGLAILATACGKPADTPTNHPPGWVDADRMARSDQEPGNWLSTGRNASEQRFSPLTAIDTANVGGLGLAWQFDARSTRGRVQHGMQATAIVVDGVMYISAPWSVVYALDAATGKQKWRYDPHVDGDFPRRGCCGVSSRGVVVWRGKVYTASVDGWLTALDAATGAVLWRADTFIDRSRDYTITSAPHIAGSKIVVGNSGADLGVRGYVSAYDLDTGAFAWRFFTVPADPKKGFETPDMELAAKSWDPNSAWEAGLGGTVWGDMAYDPALDLLYIGTGNSSPYPIWFRSPRGGDNLFLASVVAIHPSTGRMAWYYQTVPGEIWDYTVSSNLVLADLTIGGAPRKVLMTAPKNGFYYVLDRATGKLISAEKYVPVNWASRIDTATGRPVLTNQGWYRDEPKLILPSSFGGHNWMPMAFSPQTGLAYIPTIERGMVIGSTPDFRFKVHHIYQAVGIHEGDPAAIKATGGNADLLATHEFLKAWDPVAQKERWRVPLDGQFNGGVLATAGGLVVQGRANGHVVVYRATDGRVLKDIETGTGIQAAPMTYAVNGEQYIAVTAGYGGGVGAAFYPGAAGITWENYPRIIVLKLGGGAVPLPPRRVVDTIPTPPPVETDRATIALGGAQFGAKCAYCHGGGPNAVSAYPDLTRMPLAVHEQFMDIVLKGKLLDAGMANFSDVLTEEEARAIHAYLISEQRKAWAAERARPGGR